MPLISGPFFVKE